MARPQPKKLAERYEPPDVQEIREWEPFYWIESIHEPIIDELEDKFKEKDKLRPYCVLLYGPQNAGKSTLIAYWRAEHQEMCDNDYEIAFVILTPEMKYNELLRTTLFQGFNLTSRLLDESHLEDRIAHLGKEKGTRVYCFDEFHNLFEAPAPDQKPDYRKMDKPKHVLKGIKTLSLKTKRPSIMIGTEKTFPVLQLDDDLDSRTYKVEFPPLEFNKDFIALVGWIQDDLKKWVPKINLLTGDKLIWLYEHTHGLIGVLVILLKNAAKYARSQGEEEINDRLLNKAFDSLPDRKRIDPKIIREELENKTEEIGKLFKELGIGPSDQR